jgi:dTDP-4-dehydrorhamnose reductase
MRVVIFGGTGLLGSSILHSLQKKGYKCFASSQKKKSDFKSNLQSEKKILQFLKKINPNIVINCSGETNVDLCNESFIEAFNSNVLTVRNIVSAIKKTKKKTYLMHISTDQVYNHKRASVEDNIKISNYYGASKYLGEIEAQKLKNSVILRTNFYGKSKANKRLSYSDYIIYNLSKKKNINIPINVYFNPIHVDYLSQIILKLILFKIKGVFNIGSKDVISKYNFAKIIATKYKLNLKYLNSFKSVYSINQRPLSTFMSTKKLKNKLKIKIPRIQSGIDLL